MFDFISGTFVSIEAGYVVVDVNGVGFKLGMSTISLAALTSIGSKITVYTVLIVRDDALDLYGFIDAAEREMFERLISVTGVGPKVALSALSSFNSKTLQQLIVNEDIARLTTISGLGKKTAQRLILELRGTLVALDNDDAVVATNKNTASQQVIDALSGMGFTRKEIELASIGYQGSPDDFEGYVRFVLQRLGGA